jgi:hypothetical protein
MNANTMMAAFWILVGLSCMGIFAVLEFGIKSGPSGGAVGAFLLVIPLFFLLGLGVVFQATSSEALRTVCLMIAVFVFLPVAGLTSKLLVVDPANNRTQETYEEWRVRYESGVTVFPEAAQVEFLKAVRAHDVAKVKALLPAVGDLNKLYGETTLFLFALEPLERDPLEADLEIVETMLKAGADPNIPAGEPLKAVHLNGAGVVKLLLEAGADVNYESSDGEPLWWNWLKSEWHDDCLKLALAHGADLQTRKNGIGAVAYAAQRHNWNLMVILIEAGAPHKGELLSDDGTLLHDYVKQQQVIGATSLAEWEKAVAVLEAAKD